MVEVGVGEDDRVEARGINRWEAAIVLVGDFLALVHAEIDHDAGAVVGEEVAGAGDFARRAVEAEFDQAALRSGGSWCWVGLTSVEQGRGLSEEQR